MSLSRITIPRLVSMFRSQHARIIFISLCIFAVGIFFRTYHFSSWLHFEIDQTYDFLIVSEAIENGPGELPLLGPTAGGGRALRLGPGFYYLEYLSALIFGNTPVGHASIVLLFSIATLPLLYLTCRRAFSQTVSLSLTTIAATSFFFVLYGRFSWSPNVLPFLMLLSIYALLRSVDKHEHSPHRWFLGAVGVITLTTQIHFNAFFILPATALAFLLIKRPHFPLKIWFWALCLVLVLYTPVIANDIYTQGENLNLFTEKVLKSSSDRVIPFSKTFLQDIQHHALAYSFITLGYPDISSRTISAFTLFSPQESLRESLLYIVAGILFITELIALISLTLQERIPSKRDFFLIVGLWLIVSFSYFFSIVKGYRMYPRFFLVVAPLAIILFGCLLTFLEKKFRSQSIFLIIGLTALIALTQSGRVIQSFEQLAQGEHSALDNLETEDVFPDTRRITLRQQERLADAIRERAERNGYPVYVNIDSEYAPSLRYLLDQRDIAYYDEMRDATPYREANYFIITRTGAKIRIHPPYTFSDQTTLGSLTLTQVTPIPDKVIASRQLESERSIPDEIRHIQSLITWNTLLNTHQNKTTPSKIPPKELPHTSLTLIDDSDPIANSFPIRSIEQPIFPDRSCRITEYGAISDINILSTPAITAAIEDCTRQGGGHVIVPKGTYLTGALRLQDNIDLHLEEGSVLVFSPDLTHYLPAVFSRYEGVEYFGYAPLISAENATNIAITGSGTLDGQGSLWYKRNNMQTTYALYDMAAHNTPVSSRRFETPDRILRPAFIQFINSHRILLEDFTLKNSPFWAIHPTYSDSIVIRGIHIQTNGLNDDGIALDSSRNILVEKATILSGDDALVIKSGRDADGLRVNQPSENIIIRDCSILGGHAGIALGSESSGGIRNVFAYHNTLDLTKFAFRIKTNSDRGGTIENITIQDLQAERILDTLVEITSNYDATAPRRSDSIQTIPSIQHISLRDVHTKRTRSFITLIGLPDKPLNALSLENVSADTISKKPLTTKHVINSNINNQTLQQP